CLLCVLLRSPTSTLVPYTTLFRSRPTAAAVSCLEAPRPHDQMQKERRAEQRGHDAELELRSRRHQADGDVRVQCQHGTAEEARRDRKSTRLNSSHVKISYAVFCLK